MILGIGIDLLDSRRIERLIYRFGSRFEERILNQTEQEQRRSNDPCPVNDIAKRFAAKEAVAKALGTGIGGFLGWQDITIERPKKQRPSIHLCSRVWRDLTTLYPHASHFQLDLSLTDEYPYVSAFVVFSRV